MSQEKRKARRRVEIWGAGGVGILNRAARKGLMDKIFEQRNHVGEGVSHIHIRFPDRSKSKIREAGLG